MTHLNLAEASTHIDAARRTYHHYYNHSGSHGHLSGGAVAVILVLLVIVAIGYGVYKMNSSSD